ncbi:hypothetical protein RND81_03G186000 [Saponaria officinalis]|uniref:Uncharacterized protein n=1 Tax=Saponaria officinalis TaxID=3572 RepID=A0AAW1MBQ1_SAPOF
MSIFGCFGLKMKMKVDVKPITDVKSGSGFSTVEVKLEHPMKSCEQVNSTLFSVAMPFDVVENSRCEVKLMDPESPVEKEVVEVAYEGEDERDDKSPMSRDNSDFNLQACDNTENVENMVNVDRKDSFGDDVVVETGHVSDPGMAREERWASPMLTRSCSTLDTREVIKKMSDQLPPSKCQSYEQLQELAEKSTGHVFLGSPCSQSSALTHRSADKVMLKKHSSSQVLPSRSRKLWWKLFLWSHRNMHPPKPVSAKTRVAQLVSVNQQGGYSSDTLEPGRVEQLRKLKSPVSSSEICSYKSEGEDGNGVEKWDGFKGRVSGLWPQNQWVAFSGESSSFKRVEDWVKDIEIQPYDSSFDGSKGDEQIVFPPSPEASYSVAKGSVHVSRHNKINLSEELLHANSVVQSLNSSSTVAHISGMGLKAIPIISQFSSLRSVNLSNNSIVQITPGSLPRGLHVLDLSRNKISTIDGLRELTRLRVVDLSYNKISRIGHGLSNCSLLKELYLSGNKISEVEGLHRLLKLTLLDLSFNKITTTKALGQLVANYHSLLALNLLGNPIQGNLSDDLLRRAVCGLLPKLAYLNKQPVNQQKAREVSMDIVIKASSRSSSSWNSRRKLVKKGGQSGALLSSSTAKSNASVALKSKNRSKSRTNHPSNLKMKT